MITNLSNSLIKSLTLSIARLTSEMTTLMIPAWLNGLLMLL